MDLAVESALRVAIMDWVRERAEVKRRIPAPPAFPLGAVLWAPARSRRSPPGTRHLTPVGADRHRRVAHALARS